MSNYGVSDSLLPLLDISMLLLGLFIIILAFNQKQDDNDTDRDAPGLAGNVVVVYVDADARLYLQTQAERVAIPNVDDLRQSHLRGFSRNTVVAIHIEDPWCLQSDRIYQESLKAIAQSELKRARIY